MIFTTLLAGAAAAILEGEIKDKQKRSIARHHKNGFVPGVRVRAFQGPQRKREMIVEQVKDWWLIGRDDDGDTYRLLVVNCEIIDPFPYENQSATELNELFNKKNLPSD